MERAVFVNERAAQRFTRTAINKLGGKIRRARIYPLFRRNAMQGYVVTLDGLPVLECDANAILG